ncbi:MAG: hypothetical protein BJ554DRAFT_154 [Olpidium bornovanus]|uniref:Suppressor of white apricot N-terminal domain-containing protein n=1 Tax=Olpidium bornovanus TaxID=278681 RepID=A0A8H8DIF6_9FUNG|nr:MAG: hypothetical protein BJ554DRAFT_154 [Olpidium bornovanus]
MPWQGDTETRVDRFDGRNLLDILPLSREAEPDADEPDLEQELQFERYRDLVENERLEGVTAGRPGFARSTTDWLTRFAHLAPVEEEDCLQQIDEEWTDLLKHQKEMDAMVANKTAQNNWSSGGVEAGHAFRKGLLDEDDLLRDILFLFLWGPRAICFDAWAPSYL